MRSLASGWVSAATARAPRATERLNRLVAEAAGERPYALVNDVEAAWAAGLGLADGIVIIAGTGSIAYGVCRGRTRRCGGWDYELGDEGSGGWLGKELLYAFTRESDGRAPAGPLLELVRAELGLSDDFDLIAFAQEHMADRSRIAALAPLVTRAAEAGDTCARDILERAAREEAAMVRAIVRDIFEGPGGSEAETDARGADGGAEGRGAADGAAGAGGDHPRYLRGRNLPGGTAHLGTARARPPRALPAGAARARTRPRRGPHPSQAPRRGLSTFCCDGPQSRKPRPVAAKEGRLQTRPLSESLFLGNGK